MRRIVIRGGGVEVDHILGDPRARGTAPGIAMPLLAAAFTHRRVYRAKRARD